MTFFPNPSQTIRSFLRRIGFVAACLALLTQTVLLNGAVQVAAAQQKEKTTTSKKRTKKAKRDRTSNIVLPGLPTVNQPQVTADAPSVSPSAPIRTSKQTVSAAKTVAPQEPDTPQMQSKQVLAVTTATVNVRALASVKPSKKMSIALAPNGGMQAMPVPGSIGEVETPAVEEPSVNKATSDEGGLNIASPSPAQNFQGAIDEALGGGPSGTFTIPPDTTGAVGLDKIVTMLNNNMVIQDKATGAQLSLVSLTSFWTPAGGTGHFDPRVQYDAHNNRWIVAAVSNAQTANSSVVVGVSDTPDPQGTYTLFRFIVGCAPGSPGCNPAGGWADFPMLGFNKNWVVITWNQFTINTLAFADGRALVLDYPTMRAGTATATLFTGATAAIGGFCYAPGADFLGDRRDDVPADAHQQCRRHLPSTHHYGNSGSAGLQRRSGKSHSSRWRLDPTGRRRAAATVRARCRRSHTGLSAHHSTN